MMGGFFKRYPMPLAFLGLFATMWAVQVIVLPPAAQRAVIAWTSTNLANLAVDPVGTMVASAFVAEGSQAALLVVAALGLFPVVRRFGNARAIVLVAVSHVAGTLISQGIAFVRLQAGLISDSVRTISDVGPSYVLCAALVAAILYGRGRIRRVLAFAAWAALLPFLFEGLFSLQVAAVGHLVAMLSGALVGGLLLLLERRRATGATPVADVLEAAEAKAVQAVHDVQGSLKPDGLAPNPSEAT